MINEIKKLKLAPIEQNLEKALEMIMMYESKINAIYEKIEKITGYTYSKENEKIALQKIQEKTSDLRHPSLKYSFLKRHFIERKKYKEDLRNFAQNKDENRKKYQSYLDEYYKLSSNIKMDLPYLKERVATLKEQAKELQEEKKNIEHCKTLQDLNMNLQEGIKFLESNGIEAVLNEEDKKVVTKNTQYKSLDDFVLIRKIGYIPENNTLVPALNVNDTHYIEIEGKWNEYEAPRGRPDIHFTVNGEVTSHEGGDWDDMKYMVIIPMKSIDTTKIKGAAGFDTFIRGNIELHEDAWILCPKGEGKNVKEKNNKVNIMEYEGEPKGYGDAFISSLGYKNETIGKNSWGNLESEMAFKKIMKKNGIPITWIHSNTKEYNEWVTKQETNKTISLLSLLKQKKYEGNIYDLFNQIFVGKNSANHNIIENLSVEDQENESELLDLKKMEYVFGIKIPIETKMIEEELQNLQLEGKEANISDIIGNRYFSKEEINDLNFALFGEIPEEGTNTKMAITQKEINEAKYKYSILAIMRQISKQKLKSENKESEIERD